MVAGGVAVVTSGAGGSFLACYDGDLALRWRHRLEQNALALGAAFGQYWLLDGNGLQAFDASGELGARLTGGAHPELRAAAFVPVEDGFLLAWEHGDFNKPQAPVLERIRLDNSVEWSVTLPIGPVAYAGCITMRADEDWEPRPSPPWVPHTWYLTPPGLILSGDAVLACYWDMPRSGIGVGYVVSLADGTLRYTTEPGPIHEVGALGAGEFLIGFYGYGAFETVGYERDGRVKDRWPTHGQYLAGDDVRVLERENSDPSNMHVARLLPDGQVQKGDALEGYWSSPLFRAPDGTVYCLRDGTLLAIRDLSVRERLVLFASDRLVSHLLTGSDRGLFLACAPVYRDDTSPSTLARVDF